MLNPLRGAHGRADGTLSVWLPAILGVGSGRCRIHTHRHRASGSSDLLATQRATAPGPPLGMPPTSCRTFSPCDNRTAATLLAPPAPARGATGPAGWWEVVAAVAGSAMTNWRLPGKPVCIATNTHVRPRSDRQETEGKRYRTTGRWIRRRSDSKTHTRQSPNTPVLLVALTPCFCFNVAFVQRTPRGPMPPSELNAAIDWRTPRKSIHGFGKINGNRKNRLQNTMFCALSGFVE